MAKKKSKAQVEYERLRKNLLQQRRRAEKAGSPAWFDTPPTPAQAARKGTKIKATQYKKATSELRGIQRWFKKAVAEYKENRVEDLPDASQQIIDNFLNHITLDTGKETRAQNGDGGQIIASKVTEFVGKYGVKNVADVIMKLQADGYTVTRAEIYDIKSAMMYVYTMVDYMVENNYMTEKQALRFEDSFERQYGEMVPEELQ